MRRHWLLAAAVLAGCARSGLPPEVRGRAAYASYDCKRCHRVGAEGGTTGPDLSFVGFRKTREFLDLWLKDPRAWQPETQMPDFHLNEGTRKALAAYLATLRGQDLSPRPWGAEKDPLERGRRIFEVAGCVTCHGKAGKGGHRNNNVIGGLVPSLTRTAQGFTKDELARRIADGVRHPVKEDPAGPEPLLFMPAWKEVLSKEEIDGVAGYVLSLTPKAFDKDAW